MTQLRALLCAALLRRICRCDDIGTDGRGIVFDRRQGFPQCQQRCLQKRQRLLPGCVKRFRRLKVVVDLQRTLRSASVPALQPAQQASVLPRPPACNLLRGHVDLIVYRPEPSRVCTVPARKKFRFDLRDIGVRIPRQFCK